MIPAGMGKKLRKLAAGALAAMLFLPAAVFPLQAASAAEPPAGSQTEPVTIAYLQKILAEKDFEPSVNALFYRTFRKLEKNYDLVYAYGKTDRNTYLRTFCDTVAEKLNTVVYADGEEKDAYYAGILTDAGAAAYTKNGTIVLRPGSLDMDHVNLVHEVEHLNNEFSVSVNLEADSDRLISPLHEGMSARAEDFADPYPVRAMDLWESKNGRSVQIFKELIVRGNTEYTAVYQVYECLTEHLEILLGHTRLREIINGEEDVITALHMALAETFSESAVNDFLVSLLTLLHYTAPKDIRIPDMETEARWREEFFRPLEKLYTTLTEAPYEAILSQHRKMLKTRQSQAAQYEQAMADLQRNGFAADADKDAYDDAEKLYLKAAQTSAILEDKLANFSEADWQREIRLYQAYYTRMVQISQQMEDSSDPNDVLWELFYTVETDCQTLLLEWVQMLDNRDEIPVCREALRYYAENVMISCLEDGRNITKTALDQIRYAALHRQELFLNRKTQSPPHHKCGIFTMLN